MLESGQAIVVQVLDYELTKHMNHTYIFSVIKIIMNSEV